MHERRLFQGRKEEAEGEKHVLTLQHPRFDTCTLTTDCYTIRLNTSTRKFSYDFNEHIAYLILFRNNTKSHKKYSKCFN